MQKLSLMACNQNDSTEQIHHLKKKITFDVCLGFESVNIYF